MSSRPPGHRSLIMGPKTRNLADAATGRRAFAPNYAVAPGTTIAVTYECLECPRCGHRVLTGPQLDARRRQTAGLRAGKA